MSRDAALRIDPQAEAVVVGRSTILLRNGPRTIRAQGLPPAALREVIEAVDGSRTFDDVVRALTVRYPRDFVESLLRGLTGIVLVAGDAPAAGARSETLAVLGDGPLAQRIARALGERGFADCRAWENGSFASCLDPSFRTVQSERMLLSRGTEARDRAGQTPLTPDDLVRLLGDIELCVCALEWTPYRAQLDVADAALRAGTPVLFVTAARDGAVVGPMYVPGVSACFECERRTSVFGGAIDHGAPDELLPFLSCHGLEDEELGQAQRISAEVAREVESLLERPPRAETVTGVVRLPAGRERTTAQLLPRADCSRCGTAANGPGAASNSPLARVALADVVTGLDRGAAARPGARRPPGSQGYRTVGVLGGGTAGYLAALTLRTRFPEITVTLIESSRVGVIGVGEATTPRLAEYLHSPADLGRDIADFHRRVRPVWKLGVLYQWGRPGDYEFPWPFQYGSLLEPYLYEGDISAHCLGALLMAADRVPVFANGDGSHTSMLDRIPFAYHLDNARFVGYLREEAEQAGVVRLDQVIVDAELAPDGETIDALLAEGGERLSFDLYVDCSGFRSVLLEQKLRSPFVSYEESLFTDAAVVANVPHDGTVKPYTVAETMDNGWCWNIAFEDEDHRGYVFASAFCDDETAEAEMRAKNPGMSDAWTLRFRSGRHEHFCKGNVVAVGNAYAFVEPLASTAIHMLLFELDLLSIGLPGRNDAAHQAELNRQANAMWDSLRGWLAVQYRFNRRLNSPFWQTCRAEVDLAGAAEHVERFRERAPLSASTPVPGSPGRTVLARYANDYFSQDYVYDVMLLGQDVPGRHGEPHESPDEWRARMSRSRAMIPWALPAADALELARQQPEMLADLVTSPASWLGEQLY